MVLLFGIFPYDHPIGSGPHHIRRGIPAGDELKQRSLAVFTTDRHCDRIKLLHIRHSHGFGSGKSAILSKLHFNPLSGRIYFQDLNRTGQRHFLPIPVNIQFFQDHPVIAAEFQKRAVHRHFFSMEYKQCSVAVQFKIPEIFQFQRSI